jgi:tetratricopeptide (TPR) repeat protein
MPRLLVARASRPRLTKRATLVPAFLLLLSILPGCGPSRTQQAVTHSVVAYDSGNYAYARETLRPLAQKKDENFVLNNCRLGSVCIADYHLDEAEAAFLNAYEVMNSVGVNNGGRSLGATLVDEKIKVWKGEPFERAMCSFYLGSIYYMRQDYANARGAYENALFKLRDYGASKKDKDDEYRTVENDFALAYIMLGRCWQRLGREDLARANFERAAQLRNYLQPLANFDLQAKSNVVVIAEYGVGPQVETNFDGAIIGYGPSPAVAGPIPTPLVYVDGQAYPLNGTGRPTVDLLALAQDRRWQSIDTIRTIKSVVGTGLLAAGGVEGVRGAFEHGSAQRRDLIAGAALAGAGLLLKATSQADTRHWEMLPRTVFVLPLQLPPGKHDITIDFPGERQTWHGIYAPFQGDATYFIHMSRWTNGEHTWPPPALRNDVAH